MQMLSSNKIGTERNDFNASCLFDKGDNLENSELVYLSAICVAYWCKNFQKIWDHLNVHMTEQTCN